MTRFVLSLIYLIILPGLLSAFLYYARVFLVFPLWLAFFLFGTVFGILLDRFLLSSFPRVEIFEHELTHALVAFLFFRSIRKFIVTARGGGSVTHSAGRGGRFGDDFIGLAPYILPTFTVFFVLFQPLVPPDVFFLFALWIGCTFGFHLSSTLREIKRNWTSRRFSSAGSGEMVQSDIARRGFLYSAISISTWTLLIHGLLLAVFLKGYRGVPVWWRQFWPAFRSTLALLGNFINDILIWLQRMLAK